MISSSWGAPAAFIKGFDLQHVSDGLYGRHLYVYTWPDGELKQTLDLGDTGLLPLEVIVKSSLISHIDDVLVFPDVLSDRCIVVITFKIEFTKLFLEV